MAEWYPPFAQWFHKAFSDKSYLNATYVQRSKGFRWANRNLWLGRMVGRRTFKKVEDRSLFPTDASTYLWAATYERWAIERTKDLVQAYFPRHPLRLTDDLLANPPDRPEDLIVALDLCEFCAHPLGAAAQLCSTSASVIVDIPVTRKAWGRPQHQTVTFEELMRFAGKHDLVAYRYHVHEWKQYEFEHYYLLYRVPGEQTFVGATLFWENQAQVGNLERHFDAIGDSLRQEILGAYGDLAGKSVLDLGCGTGRLPAIFPDFGTYVGVDQSPLMLDVAREQCPRGEFVVSSIKKYDSSARFHVITVIDVLQHSERPVELARYILEHFRSDCVLFRTVTNDLDYPVYHITKMGTTSVSMPLAYYREFAQALDDAGMKAKIYHCEPQGSEGKAKIKTRGIIIRIDRDESMHST